MKKPVNVSQGVKPPKRPNGAKADGTTKLGGHAASNTTSISNKSSFPNR